MTGWSWWQKKSTAACNVNGCWIPW